MSHSTNDLFFAENRAALARNKLDAVGKSFSRSTGDQKVRLARAEELLKEAKVIIEELEKKPASIQQGVKLAAIKERYEYCCTRHSRHTAHVQSGRPVGSLHPRKRTGSF